MFHEHISNRHNKTQSRVVPLSFSQNQSMDLWIGTTVQLNVCKTIRFPMPENVIYVGRIYHLYESVKYDVSMYPRCRCGLDLPLILIFKIRDISSFRLWICFRQPQIEFVFSSQTVLSLKLIFIIVRISF